MQRLLTLLSTGKIDFLNINLLLTNTEHDIERRVVKWNHYANRTLLYLKLFYTSVSRQGTLAWKW